ncbi:MAG: hypothetical protein RRB13_09730 [bacterium]|nr:hypothetical protein [bacterium]
MTAKDPQLIWGLYFSLLCAAGWLFCPPVSNHLVDRPQGTPIAFEDDHQHESPQEHNDRSKRKRLSFLWPPLAAPKADWAG